MKQEWKFNYRKNGNIKERIKRGDDFTEEEKMKLMGRKHLDMNILKKWKKHKEELERLVKRWREWLSKAKGIWGLEQ